MRGGGLLRPACICPGAPPPPTHPTHLPTHATPTLTPAAWYAEVGAAFTRTMIAQAVFPSMAEGTTMYLIHLVGVARRKHQARRETGEK